MPFLKKIFRFSLIFFPIVACLGIAAGFTINLGHLQYLNHFRSPGPYEKPDLVHQLKQTPIKNNEQLFVQMSDTQFGMMSKPLIPLALRLDAFNENFDQESKNFQKAIDFINISNASFAIICGDLINDRGNRAQMQKFKEVAGAIKGSTPLYLVSGNHDVDNQPSSESLADYRKNFGKDWYTFRSQDIFGIVLNSTIIHNPSLVPNEAEKQLIWLQSTLKKAKALSEVGEINHVFVFQHHPYFSDNQRYQNSGLQIHPSEGNPYLNLLVEYKVDAVFAGHWHSNHEARYKGLHRITTGAIGLPNPLIDARSGLRLVKTHAMGFEHGFIALEDI